MTTNGKANGKQPVSETRVGSAGQAGSTCDRDTCRVSPLADEVIVPGVSRGNTAK